MSQRQAKYIAQLLKANQAKVQAIYRARRREIAAILAGHGLRNEHDLDNAAIALRDARNRVLLDIALERNVVYVEWDHEEDAYDFGDIEEREQERLQAKLERGVASVECMVVYARDRKGEWEVVDSLGMVWVDSQEDRDDVENGNIDMAAVRAALYRHRARDDFGDFSRRYVPGHWVTE